jgi:hypothetical protein
MNMSTRFSSPHIALSIATLVAVLLGLGPWQASPAIAAPRGQGGDVFLPMIDNSCSGIKPQTYFGLQLYGDTGRATLNHEFLLDTGASWVRNEISWAAIEPQDTSPAQYDWSTPDAVVVTSRTSCSNIVLTILGNPDWAASTSEGPIDIAPLSAFAEFVGALVERYDGDGASDAPGKLLVNYFEFYNEPDAQPLPNGLGRWGNDGDRYAAMLQAVYPVVKAANPNAQVVFGGIAYDGFTTAPGGQFVREFLDDVLDAGGGAFFDIMNFHVYPAFAADWTGAPDRGPGLKEKTAAVRQKLTDRGLNKPMFITEAGWHNNNHAEYPSTNRIQNRYVVELFTQSIAANVEMMVWWALFEIDGYPFDNGLVNRANQEKQAYGVFQTAVEELAQAQFVRTLPQSETGNANLEVHEMTEGGQQLYVAWLNPATGSGTASLGLDAEQVTVRQMTGAPATVLDQDDGANDGSVTISVGDPVYIRVVQ